MRLTSETQDRRRQVAALMPKNMIDESTIEAFRSGDREALRLVFETYKDRVYSIALCFFNGNDAAAKDITQEGLSEVDDDNFSISRSIGILHMALSACD